MSVFTINNLVNSGIAQGLQVVAGKRGADNAITNVNIIDNPDSYDWLSPGDFLLTTGYVFKDDAALQRQVVRELSEINCAGLGIKVQRYWNEIPKRMIEEAEKRGFPLVRIPYTYSLAQITNLINNQIFLREDTLLKRYQNIHEVFTRCVLNGGNLQEIIHLACKIINNPILVMDSNWNLLAYDDLEENPHPLSDFFSLIPREKVFPRNFVKDIPSSVEKFTVSIKRRFPDANGSIVCRVIPIATDKIIYGYIVVWETIRKLQQTDYMALEMASTTAALERIKTRQLEEARYRMRENFFDDLLQGRIQSVNAVNSLAEIHGMDPRKKYICSVLRIIKLDRGTEEQYQELMEGLVNLAQYTAADHRRKLKALFRRNIVILLVEVEGQDGRFRPEKKFCDFIEDFDRIAAEQYPLLEYHIGVSGVCQQLLDISKGYMNAQEALRISNKLSQQGNIFYFSDLISYHLLDNVLDKKQMEEFYQSILGDLVEFDHKHHTQFIATLYYYFKCGGNISAAAKEMYVHRNTFIYRIEKIKRILNNDLKSSEDIFSIQLAMHIMRVLNMRGEL